MIRLAKSYWLEAAHSLPGHSVAGGKHGHSYRVEVVCSIHGTVADGLVIDDTELDEIFWSACGKINYGDLDELMPPSWLPSSVENVSAWIFYMLDARLPDLLLERVRVYETSDRWAEVERDHL